MNDDVPFGRARDWSSLHRFIDESDALPLLGIVLGRRRVGKTFLLRELARAKDGFYYVFPASTPVETQLSQLGRAVSRYRGLASAMAYGDWTEAIADLLSLGRGRTDPTVVVLDEISYALEQDPALGSLIQHAFDAARHDAEESSQVRMILCGSALSTMQALTEAAGPLFGRASLTLRVHPFDPPTTARFWSLEDEPARALTTWVALGGTPAYRTLLKVAAPRSGEPPAEWLAREILAPERAIYTEARESLRFAGQRSPTAYAATLRALSRGARRTSDIGDITQTTAQNATYRLQTLAQLQLVRQLPDAFAARRSTWHIAEPLLRTWFAVIEPSMPDVDAMLPVDLDRIDQQFRSRVLGPGFEDLCRWWVRTGAARPRWANPIERVARAELRDGEIDVVGLGHTDSGRACVVVLGEAKAREKLAGTELVDRLEAQRAAVPKRFDTTDTRLAVFSSSGFTDELVALAESREDVVLVRTLDLFA